MCQCYLGQVTGRRGYQASLLCQIEGVVAGAGRLIFQRPGGGHGSLSERPGADASLGNLKVLWWALTERCCFVVARATALKGILGTIDTSPTPPTLQIRRTGPKGGSYSHLSDLTT